MGENLHNVGIKQANSAQLTQRFGTRFARGLCFMPLSFIKYDGKLVCSPIHIHIYICSYSSHVY